MDSERFESHGEFEPSLPVEMGLRQTLIMRDNMTCAEADALIADATADLHDRLDAGECPDDICAEWFGLEPDYIMELISI